MAGVKEQLSSSKVPAAVLWDMDGTLIDTSPLWFASEAALVETFGGTWSHAQSIAVMGQGLREVTRQLQSQGVTLDAADIVTWQTEFVLQRLVAPLPWRPGAVELLTALGDAGVKTALVTTATRVMAAAVVAALPAGGFDLIVTGEDVHRSKPDPEGFPQAARKLGVNIRECVVLEDSLPGLTAGVTSGAATIGIPHHTPLPEGAWRLWPTLAGRRPAGLLDDTEMSRSKG